MRSLLFSLPNYTNILVCFSYLHYLVMSLKFSFLNTLKQQYFMLFASGGWSTYARVTERDYLPILYGMTLSSRLFLFTGDHHHQCSYMASCLHKGPHISSQYDIQHAELPPSENFIQLHHDLIHFTGLVFLLTIAILHIA